ncbi:hypothetical protein [Roseisolibacter sp. H3M3-2]|uniref:hypothetical protein n=1 Tax=Roseisolibacter sp. H3M3-2 TaxID=3031323 RepID=UPI0023DBEAD3|nr:hypothetical protein [Roseisolibacter sp. H3M3-2]MDF1502437.1 hypothetical protein [Roseisolibacter sp. H3M3-2]
MKSEEPYDPFKDGDDPDDEFAGDGDDDEAGDDDEDEDDESEDDEDEDGPQRPAVFITTAQPVAIRVDRLDDERAPEGSVLGAFIGDRLVARSAMDPEAIDRLLGLGLFQQPVPLGLFAYEEEPGLQCRLFALIPSGTLSEAAHADEPWKASVPSYEDSLKDADEEEGDGPQLETVLLGHIVRFAADRKHPDDLAAEAVDVLHKILTGGTLSDASSRAIDDLLDNL